MSNSQNTTPTENFKYDSITWDIHNISSWIIIPTLSGLGLLGNLLTGIVFCRRLKDKVDMIEYGSCYGFLGLALSDFLFCFVSMLTSFSSGMKMIFINRSLSFYSLIYGGFLKNAFIKCSTAVTVILAIYRHCAVVLRLNSQKYLKPGFVIITIMCSYLFWILLHLPLLWTWETKKVKCDTVVFTLLYAGLFAEDHTFQMTFKYIWAIMGFVLPVLLLAYCNAKLILVVQASNKRSRTTTSRRMSVTAGHQLRMNLTLIAVVVGYFILVLPG